MDIPAGYGQVSLTFDTPAPGGSVPTIVFGIQSSDDIETAWTHVHAALHTNLNESFAPDYTPAVLTLKSASAEFAAPADLDPSTEAAPTYPATAVLMRKHTGLVGRENRGRTYWPGLVNEGQVNPAGRITDSQVTGLQTAFTGLLTDLDTAGVTMVILHKNSSDPTAVTAVTTSPYLATQRRRQRK